MHCSFIISKGKMDVNLISGAYILRNNKSKTSMFCINPSLLDFVQLYGDIYLSSHC